MLVITIIPYSVGYYPEISPCKESVSSFSVYTMSHVEAKVDGHGESHSSETQRVKVFFVPNDIKIYLTIVFVAQMLKRVDAVFSVWLPVCIVVIGIIIVSTRRCRK